MKDIKDLPRLLRQRAKKAESQVRIFNQLESARNIAKANTLKKLADEIERHYIEQSD